MFPQVPELRWMLLTYALCIAFGSIGNAVTLITMATADRKTKTVTNVFLISLAVSSCLSGLIVRYILGNGSVLG